MSNMYDDYHKMKKEKKEASKKQINEDADNSSAIQFIDAYKKEHGFENEPMDGDDVDKMCDHLRQIANDYQGNQ